MKSYSPYRTMKASAVVAVLVVVLATIVICYDQLDEDAVDIVDAVKKMQ